VEKAERTYYEKARAGREKVQRENTEFDKAKAIIKKKTYLLGKEGLRKGENSLFEEEQRQKKRGGKGMN